MNRLRSAIEGNAFPAIATGRAAELMALQRQLDASQWWPAADLRAAQWRQLRPLVAHAAREVPFYAERFRAAGIDPAGMEAADWARLPVLTRPEVQALGDALLAREYPKSHGGTAVSTTGGSTGVPVRIHKTALENLMWMAFLVREEIWHRDEPRGVMLRIRRNPAGANTEQALRIRQAPGLRLPNWGVPLDLLWETGEAVLLDDRIPVAGQAGVLDDLKPDYLFTTAANLRLLLMHYRDSGAPAPRLRSAWTLSEAVDGFMRALCHQIFGCRIVDSYTSAEGGYMALQCPEVESHYHVQAEGVLLEVLDDAGRACAPGQVGRVVITPLHNFAMPLLRYEIGDMAELGPPCRCGRGLPVLQRIVGRAHDFLRFPDGRRQRVDAGYVRVAAVKAVKEFQIAQRVLDRIELRVVLSRSLTAEEEAELRDTMTESFTDSFAIDIVVRDSLPRTEAGKLRIFVSELAAGTV